jgi:predicted Zn-dependent protease
MTNKKRLFLFTLVFLQTACTQNPARPTAEIKKPTPQPQISSSKDAIYQDIEAYKNEPVRVEETPAPNPVIAPVEAKPESKPHPIILSAAVQSLMADAEQNTKAGDLDSASVTLERALRISPRNPAVTYQLAVLRLKQLQPRLAEDLGKKAAFLAADDLDLKKRCWLLIAEARELQGNSQGANEARLKAASLE